jgi:hypothetical protein
MCVTLAQVLARETPRDFTTFSTSGAMENSHFVSPKTPEPTSSLLKLMRGRGTQTPLYRSNSTAFANVPTPTINHHLVHMCYHFHNHFQRLSS